MWNDSVSLPLVRSEVKNIAKRVTDLEHTLSGLLFTLADPAVKSAGSNATKPEYETKWLWTVHTDCVTAQLTVGDRTVVELAAPILYSNCSTTSGKKYLTGGVRLAAAVEAATARLDVKIRAFARTLDGAAVL